MSDPINRIREALDELRDLAARTATDPHFVELPRDRLDHCISEIANAAQLLVPVPPEACTCAYPGEGLCPHCAHAKMMLVVRRDLYREDD